VRLPIPKNPYLRAKALPTPSSPHGYVACLIEIDILAVTVLIEGICGFGMLCIILRWRNGIYARFIQAPSVSSTKGRLNLPIQSVPLVIESTDQSLQAESVG